MRGLSSFQPHGQDYQLLKANKPCSNDRGGYIIMSHLDCVFLLLRCLGSPSYNSVSISLRGHLMHLRSLGGIVKSKDVAVPSVQWQCIGTIPTHKQRGITRSNSSPSDCYYYLFPYMSVMSSPTYKS